MKLEMVILERVNITDILTSKQIDVLH